MHKTTFSPFHKDAAIVVCLSACVVLLYYWSLPDWWISSDDPELLAFAAKYSFWEYTFNPETWRKLTTANLTPLVLGLYDLDLALFGLNAHAHYLHNLFSAACLAGTAYIFMRLCMRPWLAALGTFAWCVTPVFVFSVHDLMSRHYLEGLLWAVLAILSFRYAVVKEKTWVSLVAGACFLIAVLYKEIYAPLVAVLLFCPVGSKAIIWRRRIKALLPCLAAAAVYPLYRLWMLGVWIGGYGDLHTQSYALVPALKLISVQMWPNAWWFMFIPVSLAVCALVQWSRQSLQHLMCALTIILGTLLPLSQVLPVLSTRHVLLPTFLLILGALYAVNTFWNMRGLKAKILSLIILAIIFFGLIPNHFEQRHIIEHRADLATAQGRFLWENSHAGDVLLVQALPSWYVGGLQKMAHNVQDRALVTKPIFDLCHFFYVSDFQLLTENINVFRYDFQERKIKDVEKESIRHKLTQCRHVYKDTLLEGELRQEGSRVHWKFRPYTSGAYSLVSSKTGSTYPLPPEGSVPGKLQDMLQGPLHLCYAHPDGWHTCRRLIEKDNALQTENHEQN